MAQLLNSGTARDRGTVKAKWYLAIGILGVAILLALAALLARQADPPMTSSPADQGVAVPANTGGSVPANYRTSPPNELEAEGGVSGLPAIGGSASYRVSGPNELDPEGTVSGGAAAASQPAYRVSPPNEQDPAGP